MISSTSGGGRESNNAIYGLGGCDSGSIIYGAFTGNCRGGPQGRPSDYTSGPSAKSINDREHRIDVPGRGRHLDALHGIAQNGRNLARDGDALGRRRVEPVGAAHPLDERLWHPHARHLVGYELGVSDALERK